jgi:DNA-binding CsgD family transcriptional regulator
LLRARGQAYETIGDFGAARLDLESALAQARAHGEARAEWQGLLDLGFLWLGRDYPRAGAYFREALALARHREEPALIATSLNRLGNWLVNMHQPLEGRRYHEEALAIFRELGDRRAIAETVDLLSLACSFGGDNQAAATYLRQALTLFEELDDRRGMVSALATLAQSAASLLYALPVGMKVDLPETVQQARRAVTLATEIGWRSGEAYARISLAIALEASGEIGGGLAAARAGLDLAKEIGHEQWTILGHSVLGGIYTELNAPELAQAHLAQSVALAQARGTTHWRRATAGFMALGHLARGDLQLAADVLDATASEGVPSNAWGQWLEYLRGELALAAGRPAEALAIFDRLPASETTGERLWTNPRQLKSRAEALAALRRTDEAEPILRTAEATARAEGLQLLLWQIQLTLGKLYRARARRAEAELAFAAARAVVAELAATIPDPALREQFLRQTMARIPTPRPLTPLRAEKQANGGLTTREREVAALLAAGKSNREIAATLTLSERTAATHVTNILSKLGFASRAQIAVWATERGLAMPPPADT